MLTAKPLLWHSDLMGARMAAALRQYRNLVESLDRHLAFVYKRRLFQLSQYAKLSR